MKEKNMNAKKVYIVSGAGLSAESGIKTFRDSDGLWENYRIEEVCSTAGWAKDRQKVTHFYDARRADLASKEPNHAHQCLAKLKEKYPKNIFMLTQNVDNMLEKAGCEGVVHLHGTLTDLRCERCKHVFPIGYKPQNNATCPECDGTVVRHNVVMFGENAPAYEYLRKLYNEADMIVVIGTSGQVIDTAYMAQLVDYSILNNLDRDFNHDQYFTKTFYLPATEAIEDIVKLVEEYLD